MHRGDGAIGPSYNGQGNFEYVANPEAKGQVPFLKPSPAYIHGTPPTGNLPPNTNSSTFDKS